jgi:hypothetical protein
MRERMLLDTATRTMTQAVEHEIIGGGTADPESAT